MCKKGLLLLLLLVTAIGGWAQTGAPSTDDTTKSDFHLSVGTMVRSGWGKSDALTWVAPSVDYRASDKLTLKGGFVAAGSLLGSYTLRGLPERNLTPQKAGTRVVAGWVKADYNVSDKLNVWVAVAHAGGWVEPLWHRAGDAVGLDATVVSGGFGYEFDSGSRLEFQIHCVNDRTGGLTHLMWDHPYGGWMQGGRPWMW